MKGNIKNQQIAVLDKWLKSVNLALALRNKCLKQLA